MVPPLHTPHHDDMSVGDIAVLVLIAAMIIVPLIDTPSVRPYALGAVVTMALFFAGLWWVRQLMNDWAF
jgi:hypothetical protein